MAQGRHRVLRVRRAHDEVHARRRAPLCPERHPNRQEDRRLALAQGAARVEVNFIGPGFVESRTVTIAGLKLNALVTITPTGINGTSIYVVLNVDMSWIPRWLRSPFDRVSPKSTHDLLAFVFTHAVIDDLSGDYRIWSKRKFLRNPSLILPKEEHVLNIRKWIETFYADDFSYPDETRKDPAEMNWQTLDGIDNIPADTVATYNISGEELVAFRQSTGNVVVLDAFCPHHGAHLGHDAKVEADCIRCPFHHFYFNAEGKCRAKNPHKKSNYIKNISTKPREHRVVGDTVQVLV